MFSACAWTDDDKDVQRSQFFENVGSAESLAVDDSSKFMGVFFQDLQKLFNGEGFISV